MNEQFIHIHTDGSKRYYKDQTWNTIHRVDGPAVEYADGSKFWYIDGKLHRVDGPACEWSDGSKFWYLDGTQHRLDGPACEWSDGTKYWLVDGNRHRVDGPAIERADGSKSWYLDGVIFSEAKFNKKINVTKASCEGKTIVVNGVTYTLKKV